MHHELKIKYPYWIALTEKRKTCELRFNDRDYQTGDTISFCQIMDYDGPLYEGYDREKWKITHVLHYPDGLKEGWVVLSLKRF